MVRVATVAAVVVLASLAWAGPAAASVEQVGLGTRTATVTRDRYGVPHITGRSLAGMWFGAGWAQAQDRLVQMELVRRNVRGTLSELFGTLTLEDDQGNRRDYYTDAELRAEYRRLPRAVSSALRDYSAGIDAWVAKAYATSASRARLVPYEMWTIGGLVGLGDQPYRPRRWTPIDTVAIGNFLAREFGGGGGNELDYERFLRYLEAERTGRGVANPALEARQIFDDALWIDDPTAPVTVPGSRLRAGARAGAASATRARSPAAGLPTPSIAAAADAWRRTKDNRARVGRWLGVPWRDGSNAYVIAPQRSARGRALLWGGPQEGFDSPNIDVEAYLRAPGYAAGGMQIAGEPYILIGQNRNIAFTTTSEELVNQQIYVERGVDFSTDPPTYRFRGRRVAMRKIIEPLRVNGQGARPYVIYRTVHGPVFQTDPANRVAYATRYASWKREGGTLEGFARQGSARDLGDYRAAIAKVATLHNFFYADRAGNIAYLGAGRVPILPRCGACDPRQPHDGRGAQEWRGYVPFSQMPRSINPRQGFLVNWNTKPQGAPRELAYQQNGGDEYWGPIYRSQRIAQLIRRRGEVRFADLQRFSRDFGTMDGDRTYRPAAPYFLPFLLRAYRKLADAGDPVADPKTHPRLAQAIALLRSWDRNKSLGSPAMSIFVQWMGSLQRNLFGGGALPGEPLRGEVNLSDESLGIDSQLGRATYNLEYHILAGTRGLDPCDRLCFGRDYFAGERSRILVQSLNDAIARLSGTGELLDANGATGFGTDEPLRWRWKPVRDIDWNDLNPIADGLPTRLGTSPSQERSTYMQMLELSTPIRGRNVLPPGQSGFISRGGALSPHFGDQITLFDSFRYKPMRLG